MKLKVSVWSCLAIWACGALNLAAAGAGATAPSVDEHAIAALVAQLGSDQFEQREAATAQLEAMGLPAYRAVRTARQGAHDPETKSRLEAVELSLSRLTFWNGAESIADYAKRMGIKETEKTILLGENKVPLKLVLIPAGEFVMGSPVGEPGHRSDEAQHNVRITQSFYMAATATTQTQWNAVAGTDPSGFKGDNLPVEMVSWNDAQSFCGMLSKQSGSAIRLPTEAQWEFACRAGTTTAYNMGPVIDVSQANYMAKQVYEGGAPPDFRSTTLAVASFRPNAWNLYDMHGNVWQWCSDWMGPYIEADAANPQGPETGAVRVVRGGSWIDLASWCRCASREIGEPDRRTMHIGFRIILEDAVEMSDAH